MTALEDAINEIKNLAKQFKERNGNTSLRIPSRDFNLWIVNFLIQQDQRLSKVETKIHMTLWFIPILLIIVGVKIFGIV